MKSLALTFTPQGKQTLNDAHKWLASFSSEAAERFALRMSEDLTALRIDLAIGLTKPSFDGDASIYFARKAYLLRVRTGKGSGKRRAAATWRVFYELVDRNGDGEADTLRVLGVYHGAARPLDERITDEGENSDNDERI